MYRHSRHCSKNYGTKPTLKNDTTHKDATTATVKLDVKKFYGKDAAKKFTASNDGAILYHAASGHVGQQKDVDQVNTSDQLAATSDQPSVSTDQIHTSNHPSSVSTYLAAISDQPGVRTDQANTSDQSSFVGIDLEEAAALVSSCSVVDIPSCGNVFG